MKPPSLPIIMLISAGAVLVLLMIVVAVLRTIEDPPPIFVPEPTPTRAPIRLPTSNAQPTATPEPVSPSPTSVSESRQSQSPRDLVPGPARDPDQPPLPYQLTESIPDELWVSMVDNTSSREAHTVSTFESDRSGFTIEVESNLSLINPETNLGYGQNRPYGTVYPYEEDSFIPIATVDGIELLVSRTGATTFTEVDSEVSPFVLSAAPTMISESEAAGREFRYAVYQRYIDGISPYLSVFQYDEPPEVPEMSRYVLISYWTTDTGDEIDWDTYQSTLVDLLNSLEPFDNPDTIE